MAGSKRRQYLTLGAIVVVCSSISLPTSGQTGPIQIGFDAFDELTELTTQISGVTFKNALILRSGTTLNELEFPPRSTSNVVADNRGPIEIEFPIPVKRFSAYFTYTVPLTITASDLDGAVMGSANSASATNVGPIGPPNSKANELVELNIAGGISRVTLTGADSGSSFVLDDITFERIATDIPYQLFSSAIGNAVRLRWRPPLAVSVTSYLLEVGLTPGATFFTQDVGNSLAFSAAAPPGVYYVRVRGRHAGGLTPPSNEVTVRVAPPSAPTRLRAQVNGNNFVLDWQAGTEGGQPSDYLLVAGSQSGLQDLAVLALAADTPRFAGSAPTGSYWVRVRAINSLGTSADSNEIVVSLGECRTVAAPTGLSASVSNGNVSLSWSHPVAGSPTGYLVAVGTRSGTSNIGSFVLPLTSSYTVPAPTGVYYVRVHSKRGAVCVSEASPEVVVRVP